MGCCICSNLKEKKSMLFKVSGFVNIKLVSTFKTGNFYLIINSNISLTYKTVLSIPAE